MARNNGFALHKRQGTPKKRKWALNPEYKPSIEKAFQAGIEKSKNRDPKYMNRGERERYYASLDVQAMQEKEIGPPETPETKSCQ